MDDAEEVREEAARLVKLVLEFSLSPSPWNVAVRERLGEVVVSARTGTGQGTTASRNLQQLADLATAVENSVAAAAAADGGQVEDGLKDESLVSIAAAVTGGGGGVTKADGDRDGVAQPAVDVRALLRAGYLTCFEDPAKDGLPL